MTIFQSIILGALQGLTEFLPVSSSGHLVLAKALMHIDTGPDISFEVFAHFGTLLSVVVVFRKDIGKILTAVANAVNRPRLFTSTYRESYHLQLAVMIVVASIPAGIVGVLFDEPLEELFSDPKLVADMLMITGLILFFTRFAKPSTDARVSLKSSVGIGIAQAIAVVPGISRSGSTISSGLFLGINQENAAQFSFLMALPVISGATLLKARHLLHETPPSSQLYALLCGTLVAFIAGYYSLKILFKVLKRGKFSIFSYYCFIIGIMGILFIE